MNKVTLMGRFTRDPEMRQSQQGTPVVSFTLAVDRRFAREGQQTADFISCVAWSKLAEFICKYFQKGSMIALCGRIQTRTYDDKDGKRQYVTEVVAEEAYFTGSRSDSHQQAPQSFAPAANPAPVSEPSFDDLDPMGFSSAGASEDDLPF